jgi:hypothetical protein
MFDFLNALCIYFHYANSEQRTANSEQRTANSEQRTANSEQRTANRLVAVLNQLNTKYYEDQVEYLCENFSGEEADDLMNGITEPDEKTRSVLDAMRIKYMGKLCQCADKIVQAQPATIFEHDFCIHIQKYQQGIKGKSHAEIIDLAENFESDFQHLLAEKNNEPIAIRQADKPASPKKNDETNSDKNAVNRIKTGMHIFLFLMVGVILFIIALPVFTWVIPTFVTHTNDGWLNFADYQVENPYYSGATEGLTVEESKKVFEEWEKAKKDYNSNVAGGNFVKVLGIEAVA